MTPSNFVHLHLHTDYSLLDGACDIPKLMDRAAALKMPAVAMTDHGNMFGAIKFHEEATKRGIKPIVGCETYVAVTNRFDRASDLDRPHHLVLLVENERGYQNLVKLASSAYLEGYYYRPRIDKDLLARHSEGLIALSACLQGEVTSALKADRYEKARQSAYDLRDIFGKGNFYIEIQDQGLEDERRVNPELVRLSRETGIPLVATNDCHYLTHEDARAQEVLMCIQTGKTISDSQRMRFDTDQFYFKSAEEMAAKFGEIPEAMERTLEIAERCNLHLKKNQHVFPHFEVPPGETLDSFFERITRAGFDARRPALDRQQAEGRLRYPMKAYEERLDREIELIKRMQFAGYFLIVWDFIRFAREKCIPVGPGRGSAAGSLASYALHITDVDPLQYDLLFERFLNPERISFPDIDIDFCMRRRGEVIEYVTGKYGRENVSQIITFGTMGAKAVVRDAARALDMPFNEADRIAKLVPNTLNISLKDALAQNPELRQLRDRDPKVADLLRIATSLEGLARHASTHAAGVVISPQPLQEIVPLYKSSKDEITTQYAMDDLEKIGLLKMDFLGLTTLTVLDDSVRMIEQTRGEKLVLETLPLDDAATYALLGKGLTAGIFQFESRGMTDILRRAKPNRLADLTALNALYRPGPMQMIDDFVARKAGKKRVTYDLPQLKEILEETYGIMVYQEQVMQIANAVAGFSLGEADVLRRAMGKKKIEEMVAMREKFLAGAIRNKVPEAKARKLYEQIELFAGYGFNKSHSAAYALVAYHTAYLKTHYPVEFMSAMLTAEIGNPDKLTFYLGECRDMGIEILPPDVNSSDRTFTPSQTASGLAIRFGLTAIKNVGEAAIDSVLDARRRLGRFDNLFQFCENVDLRLMNKRVIESLIKAGAMDSLGVRRARMMAGLDRAMELGQADQRASAAGQAGLFGAASQPEPLRVVELPDAAEWSETERLAGEKEVLGFFVTGHPLEKYRAEMAARAKHDSAGLEDLANDAPVSLAGILTDLRVKPSKKGDLWAAAVLEDLRGTSELLVFPQTLQQVQPLLKKEAVLLIKGRIRRDEASAKPKVIVSEVYSLEKAPGNGRKSIRVRIQLDGTPETLLDEMYALLAAHPGNDTLVFQLVREGNFRAALRSRKPAGVNADDELLTGLRRICGEDSVSVEQRI
ncbi:MAG TPA: DNA polymerase III subunit alpha [Terriglobia bacterium]|jgi:DNA polymerase-3 subunit alpha|nr:DNA polymerase III subunit alpha [Terriglobia bacterium]